MGLCNSVKEKISIEVIKVLVTRFENFPEDASSNRNAPFHEAFLKAFSDKLNGKVSDTPFFISLASWLQGLNTTLGQTFFENIAHHLCCGEKREYTSGKLGNLNIIQDQKDKITKIVTDLSNASNVPNLALENTLIFQENSTQLVSAIDFSADVFIEDLHTVTAIELKSVKPNSGEMRGEKQKILEGKAALFREFSGKIIKFYIGFPFDPTVDVNKELYSSYNKSRFFSSIINMSKYFAPEETLVACELWDFLSGTNDTMEEIINIINTIATPEFLNKFQYINDKKNKINNNYSQLLKEWFLYSEEILLQNDILIKEKTSSDKTLNRVYNKNPFDSKGNYDFERYNKLMNNLTENIKN